MCFRSSPLSRTRSVLVFVSEIFRGERHRRGMLSQVQMQEGKSSSRTRSSVSVPVTPLLLLGIPQLSERQERLCRRPGFGRKGSSSCSCQKSALLGLGLSAQLPGSGWEVGSEREQLARGSWLSTGKKPEFIVQPLAHVCPGMWDIKPSHHLCGYHTSP